MLEIEKLTFTDKIFMKYLVVERFLKGFGCKWPNKERMKVLKRYFITFVSLLIGLLFLSFGISYEVEAQKDKYGH